MIIMDLSKLAKYFIDIYWKSAEGKVILSELSESLSY